MIETTVFYRNCLLFIAQCPRFKPRASCKLMQVKSVCKCIVHVKQLMTNQYSTKPYNSVYYVAVCAAIFSYFVNFILKAESK